MCRGHANDAARPGSTRTHWRRHGSDESDHSVGNRTGVIDANGQVTKYLYDVRDSLAEVDHSPNPWTDPNATPSPKYVTTYGYDNLGNLSRVTRAQGDASNERVTDYSYDGLNRLRTESQYPSWPTTTPTLVTSYTNQILLTTQTVAMTSWTA